MPVNYAKFPLVIITLFAAFGVYAAPTTTLPSSPLPAAPAKKMPAAVPVAIPTEGSRLDVEQLERIQAETILLEAQALRTKAEIAAQGGSMDSESQTPTATAAGISSTLPRISEIAGSDTLSANLVMPDNSEVHVWKGQSIAGTDMTVTKITSQGVIVTHADGSTVSLPMDD